MYGAIAHVQYEGGGRGGDVVFVKVAEPRGPNAALVECDFEDTSKGSEWGYHFKFYRRRMTGYRFAERKPGNGKCVHLFYDKRKQCTAAGAIAPGQWNIDAYPFIRLSYRIPKGVPLGLCVEPWPNKTTRAGVVLGGTSTRAVEPYIGTDAYVLIDDDAWHDITIDIRKVRTVLTDLKYVRRFLFYTNWEKDENQQFWFDDFAILPIE